MHYYQAPTHWKMSWWFNWLILSIWAVVAILIIKWKYIVKSAIREILFHPKKIRIHSRTLASIAEALTFLTASIQIVHHKIIGKSLASSCSPSFTSSQINHKKIWCSKQAITLGLQALPQIKAKRRLFSHRSLPSIARKYLIKLCEWQYWRKNPRQISKLK